jgi:hypothetical protein
MPGSVRIGTPRATALFRVHSQLADVHLEDISELVGHSSTAVTETVYRHEIRPALTKGATAMNRIRDWPRPAHRPRHPNPRNHWLPLTVYSRRSSLS